MKRTNALLEYISPVLANGNDAEVQAARKSFRRIQQAAWLRHKRKTQKSFLIYLSHRELQTITKISKEHNRSITRFLKEAALAYSTQTFLVPDIGAIKNLQRLLQVNYMAVLQLTVQDLAAPQIAVLLSGLLSRLEDEILTTLKHPRSDH